MRTIALSKDRSALICTCIPDEFAINQCRSGAIVEEQCPGVVVGRVAVETAVGQCRAVADYVGGPTGVGGVVKSGPTLIQPDNCKVIPNNRIATKRIESLLKAISSNLSLYSANTNNLSHMKTLNSRKTNEINNSVYNLNCNKLISR